MAFYHNDYLLCHAVSERQTVVSAALGTVCLLLNVRQWPGRLIHDLADHPCQGADHESDLGHVDGQLHPVPVDCDDRLCRSGLGLRWVGDDEAPRHGPYCSAQIQAGFAVAIVVD